MFLFTRIFLFIIHLFVYIYLLFIYFSIYVYSLIYVYIYFLVSYLFYQICGPGSSVVIATKLRAGLSGIESRWGRIILSVQTVSGTHPASYKMGTVSFLGTKCGRGVLLITHPLLVPLLWNSTAKPLPTLWANPGL